MDCIFCQIINRQLPAEILYEDEALIAILDINPMNYGHTLVIPKEHTENMIEVAPNLIPSIFQLSQNLAKAIRQSLQADGINIISNIGHAAGQSVFHTHIHIIPRRIDDEFKFRLNLKKYQPGQLQEYAGKIRNCL